MGEGVDFGEYLYSEGFDSAFARGTQTVTLRPTMAGQRKHRLDLRELPSNLMVVIDADGEYLNLELTGGGMLSEVVLRNVESGGLTVQYPFLGSVLLQGSQRLGRVVAEEVTMGITPHAFFSVDNRGPDDWDVALFLSNVAIDLAGAWQLVAAHQSVMLTSRSAIRTMIVDRVVKFRDEVRCQRLLNARPPKGDEWPVVLGDSVIVEDQDQDVSLLVLDSQAAITFNHISAFVSVAAVRARVTLRLLRGDHSNLTVIGPVDVEVASQAQVQSLYGRCLATDEKPAYLPRLMVGPFGIISGLQGEWRVRQVAQAALYGRKELDGFTIYDVMDDNAVSALDIFKQASLENVRVNSGFKAAYVWECLLSARYINPILAKTPVSNYRFSRQTRARVRRFNAIMSSDTLVKSFGVFINVSSSGLTVAREQTAHLEDLWIRGCARACDAKGAAGPRRTLARWARYRVRAESKPPIYERLLLAAYRLIGFGERPGPAFATWLIGVFTLTAWHLRGRSLQMNWEGISHVWRTFAFWAAPSFGLINLPELPDGVNRDVNTFLLHALLAIPLLTGVVALRKFMKADALES